MNKKIFLTAMFAATTVGITACSSDGGGNTPTVNGVAGLLADMPSNVTALVSSKITGAGQSVGLSLGAITSGITVVDITNPDFTSSGTTGNATASMFSFNSGVLQNAQGIKLDICTAGQMIDQHESCIVAYEIILPSTSTSGTISGSGVGGIMNFTNPDATTGTVSTYKLENTITMTSGIDDKKLGTLQMAYYDEDIIAVGGLDMIVNIKNAGISPLNAIKLEFDSKTYYANYNLGPGNTAKFIIPTSGMTSGMIADLNNNVTSGALKISAANSTTSDINPSVYANVDPIVMPKQITVTGTTAQSFTFTNKGTSGISNISANYTTGNGLEISADNTCSGMTLAFNKSCKIGYQSASTSGNIGDHSPLTVNYQVDGAAASSGTIALDYSAIILDLPNDRPATIGTSGTILTLKNSSGFEFAGFKDPASSGSSVGIYASGTTGVYTDIITSGSCYSAVSAGATCTLTLISSGTADDDYNAKVVSSGTSGQNVTFNPVSYDFAYSSGVS